MTVTTMVQAASFPHREHGLCPLRPEGIPVQLEVYPGVKHGVGLGKGLACEPWFDEALQFWNRQRAVTQKAEAEREIL